MFTLDTNIEEATLKVLLKGEVQISDVVSFNDTMREHSKKQGITQIVLDLSQVKRMDFAGLGVLVSLSTSMQRYGRRLVLLSLAPHIKKLMHEAEIEGFFPVCESEEELNEFKSGSH